MTYDELGRLLDCDPEAARTTARGRALDRKKSRDGYTRAKLDTELTALFVARIRAHERGLDRSIDDLRRLHDTMKPAGRDAALGKTRSA